MMNDIFQRSLRDLRISVIDACNFRCPYCMPAETFDNYQFLKKRELLTFDELERLTRIFVSLGVEKLRITGGEPLLRQNLPTLIQRLVQIEGVQDIALTTNGFLLEKYAQSLKNAGLQRVNVSVDSLDETVFARMNGRGHSPERVLAGIRAAEAAGLTPIKINVVVEKGVNDHTLLDLVRYFKNRGHIVRFIEFMDVGTRNEWDRTKVMPSSAILNQLSEHFDLETLGENYPGEVAERYAFGDGSGEVGFISSVTQPFCGSCTRARLSAAGELYTCLFAAIGTDLRQPLRGGASDEDILKLIQKRWQRRDDRYSEERAHRPAGHKKVEMYHIGG